MNNKPTAGIAASSSYQTSYDGKPFAILKAKDITTEEPVLRKELRQIRGESSNNVSEYIVLLVAVLYRIENDPSLVVYTNNQAAYNWFYDCKTKSKVPLSPNVRKLLNELDSRVTYAYRTGVELWNTEEWGPIPV